MKLARCSACRGFLPPTQAAACPHCGEGIAASEGSSVAGNVAKKILGVAATGAFAVTLMACYGPAPRGNQPEPVAPPQPSTPANPDVALEPIPPKSPPASSSASPFAKPPSK